MQRTLSLHEGTKRVSLWREAQGQLGYMDICAKVPVGRYYLPLGKAHVDWHEISKMSARLCLVLSKPTKETEKTPKLLSHCCIKSCRLTD